MDTGRRYRDQGVAQYVLWYAKGLPRASTPGLWDLGKDRDDGVPRTLGGDDGLLLLLLLLLLALATRDGFSPWRPRVGAGAPFIVDQTPVISPVRRRHRHQEKLGRSQMSLRRGLQRSDSDRTRVSLSADWLGSAETESPRMRARSPPTAGWRHSRL